MPFGLTKLLGMFDSIVSIIRSYLGRSQSQTEQIVHCMGTLRTLSLRFYCCFANSSQAMKLQPHGLGDGWTLDNKSKRM